MQPHQKLKRFIMNSPTTIKQKCYLNIYFQIHQPRRLSPLGFFDIGSTEANFDDALNRKIIRKVARKCYQPVNLMLLNLIHQHPNLRITFSISGVALEQLEKYCPAVIESFRMLASTNSVEFLGETYYHSLCSLIDEHEFTYQVKKHAEIMERVLGVRPTVFRNTELIYSDRLARMIQALGFKGVYIDGIEKILDQKSPNALYQPPHADDFKLFLRNYRLSDDIAFRFSDKTWKEYPLTAQKYVSWLQQQKPSAGNLINLGMDYETFGEHQKKGTGVLKFLEDFLTTVGSHKTITMINPTETVKKLRAKEKISVPIHISWADRERDLSAWLGNDMQRDAFDSMTKLKRGVMNLNDSGLINTWRYLQTSDHFYYMSTKNGDDGNVHRYFSPYPSPYEAFMNYMNVLSNLELTIRNAHKKALKEKQRMTVKNVSVTTV
jgi:alpha-amylase